MASFDGDRLDGLAGQLVPDGLSMVHGTRFALDIVEYQAPGNKIAPKVTITPASGSQLGRLDSVTIKVTDDANAVIANSLHIMASFDGGFRWETVLIANTFDDRYSAHSTKTALTNPHGWQYVLKRAGGWPSGAPQFRVYGVDTSGNEAVAA